MIRLGHAPVGLAMVLMVAACGNGSGTTAPAEASSTTLPTTTVRSEGTADTESSAGGSFLSIGGCYEASLAVSAALSSAVTAGAAGGVGVEPADNESIASLHALAAEAPEEIADDLEVFGDAIDEYYSALAAAGIDFSDPATLTPEALQALESASASLDSPEFQAASDRISGWFEENCPELGE